MTRTQKLAYLKLISQSDWQVNSTNLASEVTDIGLDLGGSLNYDTFNERRNEYLSLLNFNYDLNEAMSLFSSRVPDTAIEAWKECIRLSNFIGISLTVQDYDENSVVVHLYYKPAPGPAISRSIAYSILNGNPAPGVIPPTSVNGEQSFLLRYNRVNGSGTFRLEVNVGNGVSNASIKVPYYVEPPRPNLIGNSGDWIYINSANPNWQLIGEIHNNEVGWLVFTGKFCPWGLGAANSNPNSTTINDCCKEVRIVNLQTGAERYQGNSKYPYIRVQANSRVFCRIGDSVWIDNANWPEDPPRAKIFRGIPPIP